MNIDKKLSSLQEITKIQLSKIFNCVNGVKYVVIEPNIIRPLEKVCGVKWLKGNGVEKIFKLETTSPNFGIIPVFYIIYSNMKVFNQIVTQIRSNINPEHTKSNQFHIIIIPKSLHIFEEELEELGLFYTTIRLHSFHWMPIQIDTGILSLELPTIYKELYLQQNYSNLPTLSKSLWHLTFVVGKPRCVLTLGQYSKTILKHFDQFNEDCGESDKIDSDFGCLIIMDRNVDYPSSLLTPAVYSALLNEVYDIKTGVCSLKDEPIDEYDSKCNPIIRKQLVNFNLDSNQDRVYADNKNRYFTEVTTVLSNLTKQLRDEKRFSQNMDLDEMKHYVQTQLQATNARKKCITNHLLAAETIINVLGPRYETQQKIELDILKNTNKSTNFNYLEESISTENDKLITLRLFCLIAITQKLSDSEIRSFWRKYLQQFGYKYSFAYRNLINADFIQDSINTATSISGLQSRIKLPKFNVTNFYTNANRLKQIPANPEKISLKYPTCSSYVFSGCYIPLIIQIASLLLNATPIDEIRTKLDYFGLLTIRNNDQYSYPLQQRSVLIYLIGGVTYAEIAACNLLETLTGSKIVVISDRVISGNDLMKDILDVQ